MNEYELPSLGNLKSPEIRAESALEEFLIALGFKNIYSGLDCTRIGKKLTILDFPTAPDPDLVSLALAKSYANLCLHKVCTPMKTLEVSQAAS